MFNRIFLNEHAEIIGIISFAVMATIFLSFLWRALAMRRDEADEFANLPFKSDTDTVHHDPSA